MLLIIFSQLFLPFLTKKDRDFSLPFSFLYRFSSDKSSAFLVPIRSVSLYCSYFSDGCSARKRADPALTVSSVTKSTISPPSSNAFSIKSNACASASSAFRSSRTNYSRSRQNPSYAIKKLSYATSCSPGTFSFRHASSFSHPLFSSFVRNPPFFSDS